MGRLEGRVVAITGASAGIGRATALAAAAEGAAVALSARRAEQLEEAAAAARAAGGRALAVPGDVTRVDDVRAFVARAVEAFGRLDVMVANAGIGYHGTLDETPPEAMRRIVDVNLLGTLYAAQAALAVFRRQQAGHLIVISSIVGRRGIGGTGVYGATKAAQVGLVESLRAEFEGTGLHASVVYPVSTATEFHDAIRRDFGHAARGHGPQQPAGAVAAAIVECMVRPRAEVYPYPKAKWLAVAAVIAPAWTDRLVKKFGRRRAPEAPGPETAGDA